MKVVITGVNGRMGSEVARLIQADDSVILAGATLRDAALIGKDVGEVLGLQPMGVAGTHLSETDFSQADGVIDFTLPQALPEIIQKCVEAKAFLVTGTTGLSAEEQAQIEAASVHIPIVQSFNMSLGVNVLAALVEKAAKALDESFEIAISEVHHQHKKDAPSGTAKMLGQVAAETRNIEADDISFTSERIGEVIGDHTVSLIGQSDRLDLTHHAKDRSIYAHGALQAAKWLQGKPAGLYSMRDVLGV